MNLKDFCEVYFGLYLPAISSSKCLSLSCSKSSHCSAEMRFMGFVADHSHNAAQNILLVWTGLGQHEYHISILVRKWVDRTSTNTIWGSAGNHRTMCANFLLKLKCPSVNIFTYLESIKLPVLKIVALLSQCFSTLMLGPGVLKDQSGKTLH